MCKRQFLLVFLMAFFAAVMIFAGTACRTDHTDSAVETARNYALANLAGLTENQRNFIRFTQPQVYENTVFPRYVNPLNINGHIEADNARHFPVSPEHDLMHSCFVWSPPDLGAKVIVVGEGERSMFLWRPYRVLLKTYYPGNKEREAAIKSAVAYVQSNMLYLSKPEMNRAKFSDPEIVYTKFELVPDLDGYRPASARELAALKTNPPEDAQISLVWKADDPEQYIVITGFSGTGTINGWTLKTGELMPAEKLDAARMTEAEIAAIEKEEEEAAELVFLKEPEVLRNPYDTPSNPNALSGGSIIFR